MSAGDVQSHVRPEDCRDLIEASDLEREPALDVLQACYEHGPEGLDFTWGVLFGAAITAFVAWWFIVARPDLVDRALDRYHGPPARLQWAQAYLDYYANDDEEGEA